MNRRAVIIGTTIAVFLILLVPLSIMFGGLPPWPVIFWFAVSHIFFCVVIWRVRPFNGPYAKPLTDPKPEDWQ
jgi:hypothetical protein